MLPFLPWLLACTSPSPEDSEPVNPWYSDTAHPDDTSEPTWFVDVSEAVGLDRAVPWALPDDCNPFSQECWAASFHGGVAVGDLDGDGWPDLVAPQMYGPPRVLRNRGNGSFEDISDRAGLAAGAGMGGLAIADLDNDGDQDILASSVMQSAHWLFVNDGMGQFTEEGAVRGVATNDGAPHWGFSVAVGDVDRDGWLDAYIADWAFDAERGPGHGSHHTAFLHNRGSDAPAHFRDRTTELGLLPLEEDRHQPFAPAFVDLDGDGWSDLALVCDAGASRLFWNDGDGTFTDGTEAAGVGLTGSEMGSTFGDYDADGDLDWFVSAISCEVPYSPGPTCSGNNLYRNDGNRQFTWASDAAGVTAGHWGWGAVFFDADHDGDLDLTHTNGMSVPFEEAEGWSGVSNYNHDPMVFWTNEAGVFTERAWDAGLRDRREGKAVATLDYDRDGDLDLVVASTGRGLRLFENREANGHWLELDLVGAVGNRDAIGARVEVTAAGTVHVREVGVGSHYQGQSERVVHVGLADVTTVDVRVRWPAGAQTEHLGIAANQRLTLTEPSE